MAQTMSVGSIVETITSGVTTNMTIGASQTTSPIVIGGALSSGSITLGGAQSTGDINIGTNTSSDIYLGNTGSSSSAVNTGICHINKLQIASGSVFRSLFCGTVASGFSTGTVPFGQTLPSVPIVVASINSTSTTQLFSITTIPSTTGFIYYKNYMLSGSANVGGGYGEDFNWIAIGT